VNGPSNVAQALAMPAGPEVAARNAILMYVCEGEQTIALTALRSLARASAGLSYELFLVDDATPSRIGRQLAGRLPRGITVGRLIELPRSLGYRGCIERLLIGARAIAESGVPYELVVKLDGDTLVLRADLGRHLLDTCSGRAGVWGCSFPMRQRDRLLLLADLLPAGLRRRTVDGTIRRGWQLGRWRPVWWAGIGLRAFVNGFRFRTVPGSFFVWSGATLRKVASQGLLDRHRIGRHGFITSEDDVLTTLLTLAVGDRLHDLHDHHPTWGLVRMPRTQSYEEVVAADPYVVHPLKADGVMRELRERLESRIGLQPATSPSALP
jgi:hypothetical protein